MATVAQTIANQANAQLSTGPTSPEGKARSSANSRKHGLTASTLYVPADQQAEFDSFRRELIADTRPDGALELEFFQRLLTHGWNLRRARSLEAQILYESNPHQDEAAGLRLQRIFRYRRDLERSFDRALGELRRLQTQRAVLLQQEPDVIETIYSLAPLAEVATLTSKTDEFFQDSTTKPRYFYLSRRGTSALVRALHRLEQNEADPGRQAAA